MMMADNDVKKSINSGLKTLCMALGKIDDGEIEGDFGLGDSLESELELSDSSKEFEESKKPTVKMEHIGSIDVKPAESATTIRTDTVRIENQIQKEQGC